MVLDLKQCFSTVDLVLNLHISSNPCVNLSTFNPSMSSKCAAGFKHFSKNIDPHFRLAKCGRFRNSTVKTTNKTHTSPCQHVLWRNFYAQKNTVTPIKLRLDSRFVLLPLTPVDRDRVRPRERPILNIYLTHSGHGDIE